MAAGVVSPVQKAMTDLETLQAKRRVKDIRLWERVDMASVPEYQRMVAYGQALLRVRVPEPIGKVAEHGIRKMREDILTVINGIIKFIEPFNPNIPTLMADNLPSALSEDGPQHVEPTSGHEHLLKPEVLEALRVIQNAAVPITAPAPIVKNFGWALEQMRDGKKVAPERWGGKKWLRLMTSDVSAEMTMPYIYLQWPPTHTMPWIPSHMELLEEDWMIIE